MSEPIRWTSLLVAAVLLAGCNDNMLIQPTTQPQAFANQGYKPGLPAYLRGTIYERTDVTNTDPYPLTGYGLVVNLQDTGDNSQLPTSVRDAMIKRMTFAGFGQHENPDLTRMQPEQMLDDPRVALVQVIGLLPVGARVGQRFDVVVRAMPNSNTSSLAHGHMYNADLYRRGLMEPSGAGDIMAYADDGDVFVNPVYALDGTNRSYPNTDPGEVKASLRLGLVPNSGRTTEDRPIIMRLRVPQGSIARSIETRVNIRLPAGGNDRPAAAAENEGIINLYVPLSFQGDWRHYLGLVQHLYLDAAPDLLARRVPQLVDAAHDPDADLTAISYCLEGLGPTYVPYYQQMMGDPDPAVAFCAARAAAFCGNEDGVDALLKIATDDNNEMQLSAVDAAGELPESPVVDHRLEDALGSSKDLVRIEAYKILADHGDRRILVEETPSGFELDIVDYAGSPLVYASRSGEPRIAVFGRTTQLTLPLIFSTMNQRFMISSDEADGDLTLFYRDPERPDPVKVQSGTNLAEVISRFGGKGPSERANLDFGYPDTVALVQALSDAHDLQGSGPDGKMQPVPLVLDQSGSLSSVMSAASLEARPESDAPTAPSRDLGDSGTGVPAATADANQSVPSFGGTQPTPPPAPSSGNSTSTGGTSSVPSFGGP